MNKRKLYAILCMLCAVLPAWADFFDQARELVERGLYAEATEMIEQELADDSQDSLMSAGLLYEQMGNLERARECYLKAKFWYGVARIDMKQYRFKSASQYYSKGHNAEEEEGGNRSESAQLAMDYLDRVQKVEVIDTVCVDRDDFLKAYDLSSTAGSLSYLDMPDTVWCGETVYTNELGDVRMYAVSDGNGLRLVMADKLLDGTWEETPITFGNEEDSMTIVSSEESNYDFPYLLNDGVTLYLAHTDEGGLGGYDIYIANGDPLTGRFMKPSNLGMPFNSPFNDFLMVIDEEQGIGWWATDRHHPDGKKLTIYVFKPAELRVNLPADSPDIIDYAKGLKWFEGSSNSSQP